MRTISPLHFGLSLLLGAASVNGKKLGLRGKTEDATLPQEVNLKAAREYFDEQSSRKLQFGLFNGVSRDPANNVGPNAVDDLAHTSVDTPVFIWALLNDDDPDGFFLSIDSYTQPSNGAVTKIFGKFEYVPNAGFEGTDSFTYTISDTSGATDTATVTITVGETAAVESGNVDVAPVENGNAGPVAVNDIVETGVNTAVKDPDGYVLTIDSFTQPSSGTLQRIWGAFKYTPSTDFQGTDSFTYTISDTSGASATATVTITVGDASGGGGGTVDPPVTTTAPAGLSLSAASTTISEAQGMFDVIVTRAGATDSLLTVTFEVVGGTAVAGLDFIGTTTTAVFPIGTSQLTVSFDVIDDVLAEGDETFQVIARAEGFEDATLDFVIADNDTRP